jgi:hypothetical protein
MNSKQVACLFLLVGILLAVQGALNLQNKAQAASLQVDEALRTKQSLQTQLQAEHEILDDWQRQSRELLDFVEEWRPFFAIIEEQQAAETGISMKVREANMFNLSQSYQQIPHRINNKENESLPLLVRASLVFDDEFSKLLNWVGMMERIKPTMRVGKISLSKGSRAGDLKMEVVLEVPLMKK